MVVADASCLLAVVLREPGWEAVYDRLIAQPLMAPELVLSEVGNGLWRRVRLGAVTPADARAGLRRAAEAFALLEPMADLAPAALDIALRRDHPIYDCFYVALAAREGIPVLTADRRMAGRLGEDADIRLIG